MPSPRNVIVITFDDGHKDNYENAYPILKKYGFCATVFISYNFVGTTQWTEKTGEKQRRWYNQSPEHWDAQDTEKFRRFRHLTWDEINEMQRYDISFQSHCLTHPFLTTLSDSEASKEIADSKTLLEEKLGVPVNFFCYPNGDYDERIVRLVKQAGYVGACITPSHGALSSSIIDHYALKRIGVYGTLEYPKFKAIVTGWYIKMKESKLWSLSRFFYRMLRRLY